MKKKKVVVKEGLGTSMMNYAKRLVANKLGNSEKTDDQKDTSGKNDSRSSAEGDATAERTTKDTAFGGKTVQSTNSFDKAKGGTNSSAEDKRRDRLDRAAQRAMTGRSTAVSEENLLKLKEALIGQPVHLIFEDNSEMEVSMSMAKQMLEVYDSLKRKGAKVLFLENINKDKTNFMKAYNFSRKNNG